MFQPGGTTVFPTPAFPPFSVHAFPFFPSRKALNSIFVCHNSSHDFRTLVKWHLLLWYLSPHWTPLLSPLGSHSTVSFSPQQPSPSTLYYSYLICFFFFCMPYLICSWKARLCDFLCLLWDQAGCLGQSRQSEMFDRWVNEWIRGLLRQGLALFGPGWHPMVASIHLFLPSLFSPFAFPLLSTLSFSSFSFHLSPSLAL